MLRAINVSGQLMGDLGLVATARHWLGPGRLQDEDLVGRVQEVGKR